MNAIEAHNLTKRYGTLTALDDVSFEVARGELFGLIGPDGAGKTTLFRLLTTLIAPDGGKATVDGLDIVRDYRAIRARAGYMPGRFSLYPDLSVEENLRTVLSGIAIAEKKGKDYIPHADFALTGVVASMVASSSLPAGISAVEVGREDALKFLAKEPLLFPGAPMGYLLLVYGGLPLGFVKNLGNRSNNLLPMARRIRMSIVK